MATPRTGSTGVVETKGDLLVVNASGDLERLPVGANGQAVVANSAVPLGVEWGIPTSVPDRAMIFMGGASMGAGDVGKHFGAQDTSNGGKNAVLSSDNQMSCGIVGFVTLLTWNSASANATTVFKINKNGLVVATLNLTGVSGAVAVVGVPCAQGDLFAVEYDAGQSPGRTTVQVWANR